MRPAAHMIREVTGGISCLSDGERAGRQGHARSVRGRLEGRSEGLWVCSTTIAVAAEVM
ncbi:MAG: hypothetical protein H6729_06790 [Deltaproteobacteria bacterium]|nr:hypothetical protein [Deltaproteobacteria bacterium]